jgi:hypothetical protein
MEARAGLSPQTRQEEIAYVKYLAHVMYTEPTIQSCCRCIRNGCLSKPFDIHESGKKLGPEFAEHVYHHFAKFASDAITMHHMCGFVAYYTEKRLGICVPHTLPLGSFTWGVERLAGSDGVWPFAVKIRGIDCNFDERRVHVFARDVFSRNVLYSPMEGIVQLLVNYTAIHESIASIIANGERVNVLVSEKIDIKDQTLNGIQMLDDARQYMVKGNTPLQQYELGVRLSGARTDTVNLERESTLQQTNARQKNIELTSIPPNSQVTPIAMNNPHMETLKENYRQYVLACHAYFGVDIAPATSEADADAANSVRPSSNVKFTCDMLEELLQQAYARCFKVPPQQVHVKIARPKLQVAVADVKALWECGIFTTQELKKRFS